MKLTELIAKLENVLDTQGDLPVYKYGEEADEQVQRVKVKDAQKTKGMPEQPKRVVVE